MRPADRELDDLIEEVTVDAYGDEGFDAFVVAFAEGGNLPVAVLLAGVPVDLVETDFDGNERRGVVAVVRRAGTNYRVSLLDLEFDTDHPAAVLTAAYRRWLGVP